MADKELIKQTAHRLEIRLERTLEEFNKAKYISKKDDRKKFEQQQAELFSNYLESLQEETGVELKEIIKYFLARSGFKIFKMIGKAWKKRGINEERASN